MTANLRRVAIPWRRVTPPAWAAARRASHIARAASYKPALRASIRRVDSWVGVDTCQEINGSDTGGGGGSGGGWTVGAAVMDMRLQLKHSANPELCCNTCTWFWLRLFALTGSIKPHRGPAAGEGERGVGGGNEEKEEDDGGRRWRRRGRGGGVGAGPLWTTVKSQLQFSITNFGKLQKTMK